MLVRLVIIEEIVDGWGMDEASMLPYIEKLSEWCHDRHRKLGPQSPQGLPFALSVYQDDILAVGNGGHRG